MFFGNPTLISSIMVSNEQEDVSGRTSAEIERVVYVRVKDFGFLDNASGADRQEQWSVKVEKTEENAGSGSIRVRKIINLREPGAAVQYVLSSKLDVGDKGSCAETPEPSTADQFNIFKYFANKGMLKDRYYFPIEGTDLMWEVDCFPKEGELYHDWLKIDLEKWPRGKELPALPMEFVEMIDGSEGMTTPETDSKIKELYETMFLTANTKTPLATYEEDQSVDEDGQQKSEGEDNGSESSGQGNADGSDAGQDDADDGASGGGDGTTADSEGDGADDGAKTNADGGEPSAEDEGEDAYTTNEAFSSAGQVLTQMVPIIGPLAVVLYGQRSSDLGGVESRQNTGLTITKIDSSGRKKIEEKKTGSYSLADTGEAGDFMDLIQDAAKGIVKNQDSINRVDMTLWPQKDGKVGLLTIKRDSDGTVRVLTKNNPGKLKWFDMSLSGKRIITLKDEDVSKFKLVGRTIHVPFDGDMVEFDVGQLRALKYAIESKDGSMEILDHNFDA